MELEPCAPCHCTSSSGFVTSRLYALPDKASYRIQLRSDGSRKNVVNGLSWGGHNQLPVLPCLPISHLNNPLVPYPLCHCWREHLEVGWRGRDLGPSTRHCECLSSVSEQLRSVSDPWSPYVYFLDALGNVKLPSYEAGLGCASQVAVLLCLAHSYLFSLQVEK